MAAVAFLLPEGCLGNEAIARGGREGGRPQQFCSIMRRRPRGPRGRRGRAAFGSGVSLGGRGGGSPGDAGQQNGGSAKMVAWEREVRMCAAQGRAELGGRLTLSRLMVSGDGRKGSWA